MNNSPQSRTPGPSFWTLGYRSFYSPHVRVPGSPSFACGPAVPRVRPSLVLRSVLSPTAGNAAAAASGATPRVSGHADGAS
jgi:hypothetical protein